MTLAAHGAPYFPWRGFFYKSSLSDVFVILDDVKMPHGSSFLTRCTINLHGRPHFLAVPIRRKGASQATRKDIQIDNDQNWQRLHSETIKHAYRRAPYWSEVWDLIFPILSARWIYLFDLNIKAIEVLSSYLAITHAYIRQSSLSLDCTDPSARLAELCSHYDQKKYISGFGGSNYMNVDEFAKRGVVFEVYDFVDSAYRQLDAATFIKGLSVLDKIFMTGPHLMSTI